MTTMCVARRVAWGSIALLAACGGGGGGTPPGQRTQPPPSLAALTVSPPAPWRDGVVRISTDCTGSGTLRYEWDLGDTPAGQAPRLISTSVPSVDYVYPQGGNYSVRVTCTDDSRQGASLGTTVSVGSINLNSVAYRTCSTVQQGQGWCVQNPLPTSSSLRAVTEVARATVWAVGENGSIVKTTDGGLSWRAQPSGTSFHLGSISAASTTTAWVAGEHGALLKTTDGGESWRSGNPPRAYDWRRVVAVDAQTVWAANVIEIYKSVDGGAHWSLLPTTAAVNLFSATRSGSAWYSDGSSVFRSVDGGATWPRTAATPFGVIGLEAVNHDVAWLLLTGDRLLRTTNGGQSWTAPTLASQAGDAATALSAVDAGTVLVLGSGDEGSVVRTTSDGGATWRRSVASPRLGLIGLGAESASRAWAVGISGRVAQTLDGSSWLSHSAGSTAALLGVAAVDEQTAWVIEDGAGVLKTVDGGLSWRAQALPDLALSVRAVDATHAWALGYRSTLQYTEDGERWHARIGGPLLTSVAPLDRSQLWALGDAGVYRSADGGASWSPPTLPSTDVLVDVAPLTPLVAWVGTRTAQRPGSTDPRMGRLFKTTDGGLNWATQVDSTRHGFVRVVAVDANTAWALAHTSIQEIPQRANSAVYRTTDGGANWVAVWTLPFTDNGFLTALSAQSALHAQVAGDAGQILQTRDGGLNWTRQAQGFLGANLYDMAWVRGAPGSEASVGWVVGQDGIILKTLTSGR